MTQYLVDPVGTLSEITESIPQDCRRNITLIGSLAVGVHYADELFGIGIRTKDADCLISPRMQFRLEEK